MNPLLSLAFLIQISLITLLSLAAIFYDTSLINFASIFTLILAGILISWISFKKSDSYLAIILFVLTWLAFPMLKPIRKAFITWSADDFLAKIDSYLWGSKVLPAWFDFEANPFLGDLLSACYFSFYFQILAAVAWYAYKKKMDFFNRLIGIYFIGLIGYFLLPAAGPSFTNMPHKEVSGLISPFVIKVVADGVTGMDVFPSLHAAISIMITGYFWQDGKYKIAIFLMPITLGIIIATVFMRYHYGIDVIFGIALAVFYLLPNMNIRHK